MMILHNPDDYVSVIKSHTCEHHKRMPWDTSWPGCTCSGSYSSRLATQKERAENVRRRAEEVERRRKHVEDYDAGRIK